jgi:hypothetical protein
MRHLGFYVFYYYSQNKESTDSISYYTNLANVSVKENKYKDVLYFTQKAINYCDNNGKTEDQAIQTYNLGKIIMTSIDTLMQRKFYRKYFVPKFNTYSSICHLLLS